MPTNPETLALLALGEDIEGVERSHVDSCPQCTAELVELTRLVGIGRAAGSYPGLRVPPPHVWDRTAAELGLSVRPSASSDQVEDRPAMTAGSAGSVPARSPRTAIPRRARQGFALVLAAAVALVAGFVLGSRQAQPDPADTANTVAQTQLAALPSWPGSSGTARVEQRSDASRVLVISMTTPSPVDGTREVWLINRTLSDMRSLGYLAGSDTVLPVPDGLDLTQFAIVDVSREPFDDPDRTHSTDSIVRGTLAS